MPLNENFLKMNSAPMLNATPN